jgi:hypothetical protein
VYLITSGIAVSVSDLIRKCLSAYELKDRRTIENLLSDDFTFTSLLRKLIDDRLKALHDKEINALLSNHTSDIKAFDVIDPLPYIGADTVIAREMDDIITFASPRNQTAQPSVVLKACHTHSLS